MKKSIPFVLTLLIALMSFTGCSPAQETGEAIILTTFFPIYVATANIAAGVDGVSVAMLAPPTAGCLHDYQLTAGDRQRVEQAGIVVMNGMGMESFLDKLLSGKSAIDASEGYEPLPSYEGEGHEGHGHDQEEGNPHVWVSPEGAIYQAERIRDGLMDWDPKHADQYAANAQEYINALLDLQSNMHTTLAPYAGVKVAVLHDSLEYFAREFQLDIVAVIKTEPEAQLSAKELAQAAATIRSEGAVIIFSELQYADDPAAEALSRETGVLVFPLDSAVSGDGDDPDAYLKAMDYNAVSIDLALGYEP